VTLLVEYLFCVSRASTVKDDVKVPCFTYTWTRHFHVVFDIRVSTWDPLLSVSIEEPLNLLSFDVSFSRTFLASIIADIAYGRKQLTAANTYNKDNQLIYKISL
jgi:hypothetical protein